MRLEGISADLYVLSKCNNQSCSRMLWENRKEAVFDGQLSPSQLELSLAVEAKVKAISSECHVR